MKQRFFIGLLSLLACGFAAAQNPGFYIGASYLAAESEWRSETDDDSGFEARLGYTVDEYLSLELAHVDLGSVKLPQIPDAGGKIDSDGVTVSVLGSYPIQRFSLTAKVGYLWAETEGYLGSIAGPMEVDVDQDDPLLGIGVSYRISDSIDVKLEYNESDNFSWTGVGINLRF